MTRRRSVPRFQWKAVSCGACPGPRGGQGLRRPPDWPQLGRWQVRRGRGSAVSPFLRPDLPEEEQSPGHKKHRSHPTRRSPASDATSSSPGVMLRAVRTCKLFQDRRPGPRGGEGPSKTGKRHRENTQVGAWAWEEQGAVVRGMTQGPGHVVWGQLPRELTKPGPGEVKQGLDARSRGSRRWGPCTKGPVGTRQHAGPV